ncbi:hypothetical protein AB0D49_08190 [Streptomyces sp. NPDC048290]|uniref:hypothetical protein n=1 Tax=Streptomyces sp. NPDC048290 TaxID=3155811 RepID=UPI0034124545
MRVKVLETCSPYYNYGLVDLAKDQVVSGGLALFLLEAGSAVEPVDDAAAVWLAAREAPDGELAPDDELDIDGTAADVLAWVGENQERAARALTEEQARDKPRSTLVKQLEKLADQAD